MRLLRPLCVVAAGLCFIACEEGPNEASSFESQSPPEPALPPAPDPPDCPPGLEIDPGPALVRRLSRLEYEFTVRDLLDERYDAHARMAPEEESLGFDNNARALQVAPLHAEQFMEAAETLASRVMSRFATLSPCTEQTRDCAKDFIVSFGTRAWRRPLAAPEERRYLALFDKGAELEGEAFDNGIELVVEALLQSPNFIYRIEVGSPDPRRPGINTLSNWEVASRLSYFLWRSMPDAALFEAARRGTLSSVEGLMAQTARMLEDDKAREGFWSFFEQWLDIDELPGLVKEFEAFTPELRADLLAESRAMIDYVAWSGEVSLSAIFDAEFTFANEALARHYGLSPLQGPVLQKVATDGRRAGLLTQGAVMAATSKPNETSPILRGIFVRERLLCDALPAPPPGAGVAPDPDPGLTTRERFAAHTTQPACAGCHRLIDPQGFAFEHFDPLGRWRETENGRPIDDTGTLIETRDINGDFAGAADLAQKLAGSEDAQRCVSLQLFRYAMGRGENLASDECTLERMHEDFEESGGDLRALVRRLVASESFRLRRAQPDEVPE